MSTDRSIQGSASGAEAGETSRQRRGIELFETGYFERVSRDVIIVINPERGREHRVDLAHVTCDCEDFWHHSHIEGFCCYHLLGAGLWRAWLRRSAKVIAPIFRCEAACDGVA